MATGEHSVENPGSIEDAYVKAMLLAKRIFLRRSLSIGNVLTADEERLSVATLCLCDLGNIVAQLLNPVLLRAEGKGPAFAGGGATYADVPTCSDRIRHWIRLRIDLAVAAARRSRVRQEIWRDLSLSKLSRELLENAFLISIRQRGEVVLEEATIEDWPFVNRGV